MAIILYHGSGNPDLALNDISIIGGVERKQGNRYGGFYAVDKAGYVHALAYARMQGGEPTMYEVTVRDDAKIWDKPGDITRLKVGDIETWQGQGVDIVRGKDFRGQVEYAIINRDVIMGMKALALVESQDMRSLINSVQLNETFLNTLQVKCDSGGVVATDVFINPTRREVMKLVNEDEYGTVRASLYPELEGVGESLFVWTASRVQHHDMDHALFEGQTQYYIRLFYDRTGLSTHQPPEEEIEDMERDIIMHCPLITRAFGPISDIQFS